MKAHATARLLLLLLAVAVTATVSPSLQLTLTAEEEAYLAEQRQWIEEKRQEEGMLELPCGIPYRIVKDLYVKKKHDFGVSVQYAGYVGTTNELLESNFNELSPYVVSIDSKTIMKAWVEALSDMTIGDLWELYIPYELGYGHKGTKNGKVKRDDLAYAQKHLMKGHTVESADKVLKKLRKLRPKLQYGDAKKVNFRQIAIMEQIRAAAAEAENEEL